MRFVVFALLVGSSAFAQSYGGYRDDPYYRGDRDRGRYEGYRESYGGRFGGNPVERAISDVQQAASSSYYARHQRGHFDHAIRELSKFQEKWQRGRTDKHALDEAIGELSHLSRTNDLEPRARSVLARDADELRAFRAEGLYDYRNRAPASGPYYGR